MSGKLQKIKIALWETNPNCYWCGRLTKIYKNIEKGIPFPDDMATIDHIYTKNDPRRIEFKIRKKESPVVLSCFRCNNKRGNRKLEEQEKKFNIVKRTFMTAKKIRKLLNEKEKIK